MSQDQLVCASCSGRVIEGRCPICRAARAEMWQQNRTLALVYFLLAALAVFGLVFGLMRSLA